MGNSNWPRRPSMSPTSVSGTSSQLEARPVRIRSRIAKMSDVRCQSASRRTGSGHKRSQANVGSLALRKPARATVQQPDALHPCGALRLGTPAFSADHDGHRHADDAERGRRPASEWQRLGTHQFLQQRVHQRAFEPATQAATIQRRQSLASASTRCTTRSAATMFWSMPGPSAAPTRARRAWTVRFRGCRSVRRAAVAR